MTRGELGCLLWLVALVLIIAGAAVHPQSNLLIGTGLGTYVVGGVIGINGPWQKWL